MELLATYDRTINPETIEMKKIILLFFVTIFSIPFFGQTLYSGLERISWKNDKGKTEYYDAPRKWYHENLVMIENDSIFIYKVPLRIVGNRKYYSASDGAFYYFYGVIRQSVDSKTAYLASFNCDYCGKLTYMDSLTGYNYPKPVYDTLKMSFQNGKLRLGNVIYEKTKLKKNNYFPYKASFYLDSNSIYRENPKEQYELISQGIKNFIQTKELIQDGDTIRICIDRFSDYKQNELIETLNPNLFRIDTTHIVFKYYTTEQLKDIVNNSKKPIRVIMITEIIEHWKSANISLKYKILLPSIIHNFSEKEYHNTFEYEKVGQNYKLIGQFDENSWGLIQQK